MALMFRTKSVATAKLHDATQTTKYHSIPGVANDGASPAVYETQLNKLLAIAGKAVVADEFMSVTQVREAVDVEY